MIAWARRPCYARGVKRLMRVRLGSFASTEKPAQWSTGIEFPSWILRCESDTLRTTLRTHHGVISAWQNPLEALTWMSESFFLGGRWVGFINYDLGGLFESLPYRSRDDLRIPLFVFTWHPERYTDDLGSFAEPSDSVTPEGWNFTREQYQAAVQRVVQYIKAGDVFQVNLSQRYSVRVEDSPLEIYRRLQKEFPAKYGALLDYGDVALVSNSPELFLKVTKEADGVRKVVTRPIKGTRRRADGAEEELRKSVKDQAELNMIVDVERNDLGRICEIGSVKVTEPRAIETHPTVVHGVATIEGVLREDVGFVDLLRATFPTGSVTGAPKIRAMEIIDELEPTRRGAYCGAIGYLDSDGTMEFSVAIRTMTIKDGVAYVPVGGGIVADSDPESEYQETLIKARAMLAALGVEQGE